MITLFIPFLLFSQGRIAITVDDWPEWADSLFQQGGISLEKGDYREALLAFEQARKTGREQSGDHSAVIALACFNIGECYYYLADYRKSWEHYLQAIDFLEKALDKEDPKCLGIVHRVLDTFELLSKAEPNNSLAYSQSALEIVERMLGKESLEYAQLMTTVGLDYVLLGDSGTALDYHKQALEITQQRIGQENAYYANILNNIGYSYQVLGDFETALAYSQRALAIRERVLGKENPFYAHSLENIGICLSNLGDTDNALAFFQQALEIKEITLGKNHPEYAKTLALIGNYYYVKEEYGIALVYLIPSLEIRERVLGSESPEFASSLHSIAHCYRSLGNFSKYWEYESMSMMILMDIYGENHPSVFQFLLDLGFVHFVIGEKEKASELFWMYFDHCSSFLTRSYSTMTESQRALLWNQYSGFINDQLFDCCVMLDTPEMNRTAYNGALLGKGILLNAEIEISKLISESGDEEALRMFESLRESRTRLDRLYEMPEGRKAEIDSLNNDIETRQQELMRRSKAFGDYTRNLALKWTDVQATLGKKDIAIEFETYTHQDTTFYVALTLKLGYSEPHLVELFNSTMLLPESSSKKYYNTTVMTDLVWGNLSKELDGVDNVYFSPAGELNNMAIEYMLDKDGRHILSQKRNYYRLTSTRELVKEHKRVKINDAIVYGGILYAISPKSRLIGEESSELQLLSAERSYFPIDNLLAERGSWEYLPGTKEEAEAVSSILSSKKVYNDLLEGEDGTEESFKALSGAEKDIIHIATHGFFWTETDRSLRGMEDAAFLLNESSNAPIEDIALTHSGLLFAGAKNTLDGKEIPLDVEDGILTAKEISRVDLRGTDLVVISACQSGLGDVTGDGVFGLQRGFKKAGVKSIIMSLWKVNDDATRIMMTRFYENLAKGKSKFDSFSEAQKYLRKYKDEDGETIYDKPEHYAAFVLLDAIQ